MMRPCPRCKNGRQFVHLNTTNPKTHGFQWVHCDFCKGRGEVTVEALRRIEEGKRRRDDRVKRGVGLREEADRLGLTPTQLSRLERGYTKEPTP